MTTTDAHAAESGTPLRRAETHSGFSGEGGVHEVTPQMAHEWARSGEAVLIDVREPFEHASVSIRDARLMPLGTLGHAAIHEACGGRRPVFVCRTGRRSLQAAERFVASACAHEHEAFSLAGGVVAWESAGLPVERSASAPRLDVMRQVQIVAGGLVAVGTGLGAVVSPWWLIVPGFVGCGLVFAGATGFCGMAKVLAKMPWNRVRSS